MGALGGTIAEKMKFCPLITVMSNPSNENSFQANTIVNTGPTMYNMVFINQYHSALCDVTKSSDNSPLPLPG